MKAKKIFNHLFKSREDGKKLLAVLIDPDKSGEKYLESIIRESEKYSVDYFFVGGSLITSLAFHQTISFIKQKTKIPVIIFPASSLNIDEQADGLLFLSLISGRNPDFLIGQHVIAAPRLKHSAIEILSTGYILVDGGKPTTVSYISNTTPIPSDKPEIAASTALAGQLMGMQLIYLDSGSGADKTVSPEMIQQVKEWVECPVVVGGGIDTPEKATACWQAGADIIVIGNAIEKDISLISKIKK